MERKRKRPWRLFLVIAALIGICAGLYFGIKAYNVSARMSRYEEIGQIQFPSGIKEVYNVESDHGFQGDGLWYTVFHVDGAVPSFLGGASGQKDGEVEKSMTMRLNALHAEQEWYPDFTHPYVWKKRIEDDFKQLYILYDPQNSLVYFLLYIV